MSRWSTKTSLPVTFLYDTYVLLNSNYSVLAIGPPYWYVIPPHICYQYSYILLQSNTYIDCTTVTVIFLPLVALTDTERWLDGLLYCSRYWTFVTTIGCRQFLNTGTHQHSRFMYSSRTPCPWVLPLALQPWPHARLHRFRGLASSRWRQTADAPPPTFHLTWHKKRRIISWTLNIFVVKTASPVIVSFWKPTI